MIPINPEQFVPKKVPVQEGTNNQGLSRIYFFRRKYDGELMAFDTELQASHLMRRKHFRYEFDYLGWTDGREYWKEMDALKQSFNAQIEKEIVERAIVGDQGQAYRYTRLSELQKQSQAKVKELQEAEAERAIANPDKTQPRDFRMIDLNGNPQGNNPISQALSMMR